MNPRPFSATSKLVRATLLVAAMSVTLSVAHFIDALADPASSSAALAMHAAQRPA